MNQESADLSPMVDSHASLDDLLGDPGSPLSNALRSSSPLNIPNMYTIPNAVHMEVQENAKLPTFNLPVDRSNSTTRNTSVGYDPATATAIDEMVRLSENDFNLTELFLTDKRSNASVAFGGTNALYPSPGRTNNERHYSISSLGSNGLNELLLTADSNMKAPASPVSAESPMHPSVPPLVSVAPSNGVKTTASGASTSASSLSSKPDAQSYYPHGRRYPLPIPTKVPSPGASSPTKTTSPTGDPLAVAISTAAAIASQRDTAAANTKDAASASFSSPAPVIASPGVQEATPSTPATVAPAPVHMTSRLQPSDTHEVSSKIPGPTPQTPKLGASQTTPKSADAPRTSAPAPSSSFYNQQSRAAHPSHAAAHASSPASIKDATKQRSQFGFGGNHVVPSVPLPPPKSRSQATKKRPAGAKQTLPRPFPATTPTSTTNSGAAYERKKQRAKDARVKLNDSIERLSIAINLVGTQSTQRAAQINSLDLAGDSKLSELVHGAQQIMDECQATAAAAKKWDRPSFVGTAAALLQGMNSQCDAIMRILMEWRMQTEQRQEVEAGVGERTGAAVVPALTGDLNNPRLTTASQEVNPMASSPGKAVFNSRGHGKHELPGEELETAPLPPKRQRTDDKPDTPVVVCDSSSASENGSNHQAVSPPGSLFSSPSVVQTISSFLDPCSLCRCLAVSKNWKKLKVFQNESTWQDLCMRRYGLVAVRRWQEDEDDEYEDTATPVSMGLLYKRMDAANVKPQCHLDGNVLLGDGKLQGVASAWVSLVERSNGETARSVRRTHKTNGVGEYTSLPVVELRILIQNTGVSSTPLVIKDQVLSVDASTRRRGEELEEIQSDDRFRKTVLNADGSTFKAPKPKDQNDVIGDLCRLNLFESVVIVAHIHARGCSTTSKFQQRANFAKVLVTLNGTAIPLVVPFRRTKVAY